MIHTPLIATIVGGLGLAFVLGTVAHRLRLSPLVGYLAAGVLIGPHTPGFVGDQDLARQLAEVGVILLMFGTGLHFSLTLLSVKGIAIPCALAQMALVTLLGSTLAQRSVGHWKRGSYSDSPCRLRARLWFSGSCRMRRQLETERGASRSAGSSFRTSS